MLLFPLHPTRSNDFQPAASKRFDFFISPALSTNVNTSRSIPDTTQVSETTSKLRSWESHATPFVWKCYATFANNHREWPLDWTHVCVSRPWEEQRWSTTYEAVDGLLTRSLAVPNVLHATHWSFDNTATSEDTSPKQINEKRPLTTLRVLVICIDPCMLPTICRLDHSEYFNTLTNL